MTETNRIEFKRELTKELDIEKAFGAKTLKQVNKWLKQNVHQYGDSKKPLEILKGATGEDFNPNYYVEYLKEKYTKLYNLK